jgi:hypothetical protein
LEVNIHLTKDWLPPIPKIFDHCLGPEQIQRTFFALNNQYFNDKLALFYTEVSFDNSEGKKLSYLQNGYLNSLGSS